MSDRYESDPTGDLPEDFKEARAKDEVFWQKQEQRIQGALGQPCCTLSGIGDGLIKLPGNFAVIVHGEDECAACFRHIGPSTPNFFSVGLTEREFVVGETKEPLQRCLRLVAEEVAPDAIFILGACPVEVIGDRFETYVAEVQKDFPDIPMVPLHTSGLKVGSQAAMLDWMFSSLASLAGRPAIDPQWKRTMGDVGLEMLTAHVRDDVDAMEHARDRATRLSPVRALDASKCLNFLGLPRTGFRGGRLEHIDMLSACGLQLVSSFPYQVTFDDWLSITHAKATFVVDRSLYPKLVKTLEKKGQLVVEVPLPTGVEQTAEFYRIIAKTYGVEDAMEKAIAAPLAEAEAEIAAFRARHAGLQVAMGLRMNNNYQSDQLAYQGLGDFKAFEELGFDMTLLVQGPPDRRERIAKLFAARGITQPFDMFPEPWTLSKYLDKTKYQVAYLADHCRTEARKAGVPMVVNRAFEPFFNGVGANLRHLERALREVLPVDMGGAA